MAEDQDARPLIDGMPSVKTTILDNLRVAITYRLHNFWDICRHYDQDWRYRVLQLKSYKGRQKGLEEIGRRLTFGSAKYGSDPRPHHIQLLEPQARRRPSFVPQSPVDKPNEDSVQHYIIAFGNGSAPLLRGKLPAPSKRVLDHLKSLHRRNVRISIIVIDEYLTSQVCAECHQRTLVHLKDRSMSPNAPGAKIHAVLKCTSCSTVWNRDVMAAKNILYIFLYMALNNNERPDSFKRPQSTNAEEDAGRRLVRPRGGGGGLIAS